MGNDFSRRGFLLAAVLLFCLQVSQTHAAMRYARPAIRAKTSQAASKQIGQPTPSPFAPAPPAPAPEAQPSREAAQTSPIAASLTAQPSSAATNDQIQALQIAPARPRYIWVPRPFTPPTPEKIEAEKQKVLADTIAWQKQRADAGSERAAFALGIRYLNGDGVPQDLDLGRAYLRKAADAGFAMAEKEWQKSFEKAGTASNAMAKSAIAAPDSAAQTRAQNP